MEREGGWRGRGEGEGVDPAQIPGKRHRSSPPSGPVVGEGGGRGGGEEGMGERGGREELIRLMLPRLQRKRQRSSTGGPAVEELGTQVVRVCF